MVELLTVVVWSSPFLLTSFSKILKLQKVKFTLMFMRKRLSAFWNNPPLQKMESCRVKKNKVHGEGSRRR